MTTRAADCDHALRPARQGHGDWRGYLPETGPGGAVRIVRATPTAFDADGARRFVLSGTSPAAPTKRVYSSLGCAM